jgi:hypothetical protein
MNVTCYKSSITQVKTANRAARARGRSIGVSVFPRIPSSVTLQVSQPQSSGVVASIVCLGARSFVCVDSRIVLAEEVVLIMQWDRVKTLLFIDKYREKPILWDPRLSVTVLL